METYCPFCKKEVEFELIKKEVKEFKGVEINSYKYIAICKQCNESLYIEEIENENNLRIKEKYREISSIITPDQIIQFRKKYNLSQRELTAILEFGKMTINKYEHGGLPTKTQSEYIKLLIDNKKKFYDKVKNAYSKNNISKKTLEKVISTKSENNTSKNNSNSNIQTHWKSNLVQKSDNDKCKRLVDIYFKLDKEIKNKLDQVCSNLGLSVNDVFEVLAKKIAVENRIPFDMAIDPFYSESNIAHLRQGIADLNAGKGTEHDIIE